MAEFSDFNEVASFEIARLRADVASGRRQLRITSHAQVEAFKDGLLLKELRFVFEHGDIIEIYPEDSRGLLYADLVESGLPVHIVVEDTAEEGVIVTAYVPDKDKWIANRRRRRQRKKKR